MAEILEFAESMLNAYGIAWTLVLALLCILVYALSITSRIQKNFTVNFQQLTRSIDALASKVSAPFLCAELSIILYKELSTVSLERKLKFVGVILEKNQIQIRQQQIRKNITAEFTRITSDTAGKLAYFASTAGDLGQLLIENLDLDQLINETCQIVFSDGSDHQKIMDLRVTIAESYNKIIAIIERRGNANRA